MQVLHRVFRSWSCWAYETGEATTNHRLPVKVMATCAHAELCKNVLHTLTSAFGLIKCRTDMLNKTIIIINEYINNDKKENLFLLIDALIRGIG